MLSSVYLEGQQEENLQNALNAVSLANTVRWCYNCFSILYLRGPQLKKLLPAYYAEAVLNMIIV